MNSSREASNLLFPTVLFVGISEERIKKYLRYVSKHCVTWVSGLHKGRQLIKNESFNISVVVLNAEVFSCNEIERFLKKISKTKILVLPVCDDRNKATRRIGEHGPIITRTDQAVDRVRENILKNTPVLMQ